MSQLTAQKLLHGFRLKRSFEVPEFRLLAAELVHEKTKARYWHLRRDDPNKVFSVQFRTTPTNDSGISHVLEHTVLCGSEKFPVRDPFFKMLRRSQATFMNAFTADDWTMYPFSTMNDTDFKNLCSVYTDAVFRPLLKESDFMQEGWRFEPENLSDSSSNMQIKGVVYNEMKGVASNSLDRFALNVQNKLLPKTYPFVSGGDPDCIPSLTWQSLKEFHQVCYHPSNACFYTYGDANLDWCLEFLDKEYLQHADPLELQNQVDLEPVWDAPRMAELFCEPDPMAPDPERQSFVALSCRLDDIRNVYTNFVLAMVSKLLLNGDNAPLYRGLIESGYATDWAGGVCGIDSSARTTTFHVGVQGVRAKDTSQYTQIVNDIMNEVLRTGFPKNRIDALLHQYELQVRHESASFGLDLIFSMPSLVNHDADISEYLHVQDMINRFREDLKLRPFMLQDMIQTYMLDNKHVLLTTMRPDESWQVEELKREKEAQQELVARLSDSERDWWLAKSRELLAEQDCKEDLSVLPCLELLDIPPECRQEPFVLTQANGCSLQLNEARTNGIVYFHALADLTNLPQDLLAYVPLFCELFPNLGADGLRYSEMDSLIELHTGGLHASAHVTPKLPGTAQSGLHLSNTCYGVHLSGRCLATKCEEFFSLWSKLFRAPTWSDRQRLATLILMSASDQWSANEIGDSGHHFAMRRAAANLSTTNRLRELWFGLEQAGLMKQIASSVDDEHAVDALIDRMVSIWKFLANANRLKFSLHGESDSLPVAMSNLEQFVSVLPRVDDPLESTSAQLDSLQSNTYVVMPFSVHHTAQALPAPSYDSPNYPTFRVLSKLLGGIFLHREIREKGGAYGGQAKAKPETLLFYSYRDPHARQSLDAFRRSLDWALATEFTTQDIDQAKLAVFQELDQPVSAGSRGLTHFLSGINDSLRQLQRQRLFAVDNAGLHAATEWLLTQVDGPHSGQAVLGPSESSDWWSPADSQSNWNRLVMQN